MNSLLIDLTRMTTTRRDSISSSTSRRSGNSRSSHTGPLTLRPDIDEVARTLANNSASSRRSRRPHHVGNVAARVIGILSRNVDIDILSRKVVIDATEEDDGATAATAARAFA